MLATSSGMHDFIGYWMESTESLYKLEEEIWARIPEN